MALTLLTLILIALALALHHFQVPLQHRWRRRQARTMAAQLRGRDRDQPPQLLYARLRAMDPLAFDELLLESFERRGQKVIRNRRYTGDGGIEWHVVINGIVWFIQAKRYADSIRPDHVVAFAALCRAKGRRGLFIHTGRTGPQSRAAIAHGGEIEIISGRMLLAVLTDGSFPDFPDRLPRSRSVTLAGKAV